MNVTTPEPLALTGITQIAVDTAESAAVRSNGTLPTWGGNDEGQLGLGSINPDAPTTAQTHLAPRAGHRRPH